MRNEAVGAYEAAALMGVHFTRPKRMADLGLLSYRHIEASGGIMAVAVYSSRECDDNFADYQDTYEIRRRAGEKVGRPRGFITDRLAVLGVLNTIGRPRIAFDDAIGVIEAANIIGVYHTRVTRLIGEGKIVGRVAWSKRGSKAKLWIISRASCETHAAAIRNLERAGLKRGRPRGSQSPHG